MSDTIITVENLSKRYRLGVIGGKKCRRSEVGSRITELRSPTSELWALRDVSFVVKRAETALKFDEIVAFAEVEKFIDTPVSVRSVVGA